MAIMDPTQHVSVFAWESQCVFYFILAGRWWECAFDDTSMKFDTCQGMSYERDIWL